MILFWLLWFTRVVWGEIAFLGTVLGPAGWLGHSILLEESPGSLTQLRAEKRIWASCRDWFSVWPGRITQADLLISTSPGLPEGCCAQKNNRRGFAFSVGILFRPT